MRRCASGWRRQDCGSQGSSDERSINPVCRESYGELVQIDGSDHRWFEKRGEPCTLLVFIDDATSKLMQLRFVPSESTDAYFAALRGYLDAHGCPVAFYSDKHSVFRSVTPNTKGEQSMTQFGRALAELNIEILCANSSQAKGRAERANRTLQDRLVKELRLANINDMEAGNTFLPAFVKRFNEHFAVQPARPEDLHRRLPVAASRMNDILCHRERRYVGAQLTLSYDRRQIILEHWSRRSCRRALRASTLSSMTSSIGPWRCAGRVFCFPTASSVKTSVSRTQPWSKTSASGMRSLSSKRSRIRSSKRRC